MNIFLHHLLKRKSFYLITPVFTILSAAVSAQQDTLKGKGPLSQPVYVTSRLTTARPVIDGKLDDPCWKTGDWASDWTQSIPNEGGKPTYRTDMMILYDDRNLYVAFRAHDSEPKKIKRLAGVRDEFMGDIVGINFDSYRDYRTGFEFNLTAWGQKIDLILFNPDNWDVNWQAVWKGRVGMEDSAWVAEFEIPFSQLRYSNRDEQVWGLHTWRAISRMNEEDNWEKQTKTGPGIMYNFGELRGIKGLKKSHRLEILPYSLGSLETMKKTAGDPFTENGRSWSGKLGLDAKIGISSNFTLDLTVNPDFGQVESDPSVMNLTAFETFYQEKRPFFLEGLTIFNYDFDDQKIFYSRRIGHAPSYALQGNDSLFVKSPAMTTIWSAAKFSGTTSKGLSVGLVQSITGPEYARVSDNHGNTGTRKVEPLTSYTVARIQKGYNAGTTVLGGIFTSTNRIGNDGGLDFLTSNAFTGGLDLIHRWRNNKYFIDARLLGSFVEGGTKSITVLQESSARYFQRPGAGYLHFDTARTSLSGSGGKFFIGRGSGLWRYNTGVSWLTPGLELNDLGYMTTVDQVKQTNEISYFVNHSVSIFRTYSLKLDETNSWNFNGTYQGSAAIFTGSFDFKNQWSFLSNISYYNSAVDPRRLRGGYDFRMPSALMLTGTVTTDQSKRITGGLIYNYKHYGSGSGRVNSIAPSLSVRPLMMLKLSVSAVYETNQDALQFVATENTPTGVKSVLGRIDQQTLGLTFRADLNITPQFSVQYYGSPFVSKGTFGEFKKVTNPRAPDYADRFEIFNPLLQNSNYTYDENHDGIPEITFGNPDFNFHQFRSNLVAKWEYRLGSFIYLVWSSDRTETLPDPGVSLGESIKQLRKIIPNNVFLIKLNYWFSL
ncbi:MAG TPA: DUF5916 domain-containing protein [Bacteroidales bacterium]|nr:DUF5916 domain-containing protein [Bacteroidales bacterium]